MRATAQMTQSDLSPKNEKSKPIGLLFYLAQRKRFELLKWY